MKNIIVKKSWLSNSDLRLDASFYLSDAVKTKIIFESHCPYDKVSLKSEALELFKGNIHKRVYVSSPEAGLTFLSASDLFKADTETRTYVSKKYSPYLKELELQKGWIFITRSGTLGKVVFTNKEHEGKIGTDDLVRIKPANRKLREGFLYALLASKYGFGLLTQSGYGGVVKHIEPHHIENIEIPVFPDKLQVEINNLITDSVNHRVDAAISLRKSHSFFHDRLKGSGMNEKHSLIDSKRLQNEFRFGGNFYLSKGESFEKEIRQHPHFSLSEFVSNIFTSGRDKRNYTTPERGIPFLSNGDLSSFNPFSSCNYIVKKNVKSHSLIKENMILAGRVGQDTVGQVYLPYPSLVNTIASDNIIRIVIEDKKNLPFIFSFLSSNIGFEVIRKRKTGVGQPFITEDMLDTIPIPALEKKEIESINQHISEYKSHLDSALKGELKAIELVENEIESWQKS